MNNITVAIIMAGLFVGIIGLDIVLALDKHDGNTYSERMRAWAKIWPPLRLIIMFGMGLVAGHWWWTVVEFIPCK